MIQKIKDSNNVTAFTISPSGEFAAVAYNNQPCTIYFLDNSNSRIKFLIDIKDIRNIQFSYHARFILLEDRHGICHIWNNELESCVRTVNYVSKDLELCYLSKDGRYLVSVSKNNKLEMMNIHTEEIIYKAALDFEYRGVDLISSDKYGSLIALVGENNIIALLKLENQKLEYIHANHQNQIIAMDFDESNSIYTGSYDGSVRYFGANRWGDHSKSEIIFEQKSSLLHMSIVEDRKQLLLSDSDKVFTYDFTKFLREDIYECGKDSTILRLSSSKKSDKILIYSVDNLGTNDLLILFI